MITRITSGSTSIIKKIIKGVSYFSAIFGACAIIWGVSGYFHDRDNKTTGLENKVNTVIINQQTDKLAKDTILMKLERLNKIEIKVDGLQHGQSVIIQYLFNNKQATKEDLLKFLDDLKKK